MANSPRRQRGLIIPPMAERSAHVMLSISGGSHWSAIRLRNH